MHLRHCCLASLLAFSATLAVAGAHAGAAYPERPIRVVIPYPPGAAGDIALRQIQPLLERELGQPLVVDYRTGAGGNIGTAAVARAAPDGYTVLLAATNNLVINQFLYRNLGFDPLTDLQPLGKLADVPSFVYVNGQLPVQDVNGLRSYAAQRKGALNYGSPGTGTAPHLSAFMLSRALDADMTHIPYRGAAPGVVGLLANEVQLYIGGYSVAAAYLADGRVRPLAVAMPERFATLPDVPTLEEAGLPKDIVMSNWWAFAVPSGTPAQVVDRLSAALNSTLERPEVQEQLTQLGFVARPGEPAGFAGMLAEEANRWQEIVRSSGITVDD